MLKLDDFCIGEGLIKGKDVFNSSTAEAVNALVVVADNHQISRCGICQKDRQLHLCYVGILELVHTYVAEATLIRLADLGVTAQEQYGLHNDVVKVKRVGFTQIALVFLINARHLLLAVVLTCLKCKGIG